jgi:hypothetical protein
MTWKRCNGCTRAISVTAFTCEYCGQLCDDVMDFLPSEERTQAAPLDSDVIEPEAHRALPPIDTAELWADGPAAPGADVTPPVSRGAAEFSLVAESRADDREDTDAPVMAPAAVAHAPLAAAPGVHAEVAEFGLGEDPWSLFDEPAQGDGASVAQGEASSFDRFELDVQRSQSEISQAGPEAPAPAVAAATRTAATTAAPMRLTPRQMAMAGAGVVAASALIFTTLSMRGSASPEPAPAAARPAAVKPAPRKPAVVPAAAAVLPADAPKWSRVSDGRWVGTSRHAAAFELPAVNRVRVWTRDVTPVLVVRCDQGGAEAFVFTQSAARMEPQDGDHTVRVAFDGGQERTERWPDSAEHDALFARHHQAFTQQLARSSSLRFGFTPHNADPVIATFAVDGLAELLAAHSRQCGWTVK